MITETGLRSLEVKRMSPVLCDGPGAATRDTGSYTLKRS